MGATDIKTAENGVEALAHLNSADRPPDMMLIDLDMPEMDGYELKVIWEMPVEQDGLAERARRLGDRSPARLRDLATGYPAIRQLRGIGLLMALEFDDAEITGRDPGATAEAVAARALENGLNVSASEGRCITLSTPLIVSEQNLDAAFRILGDALASELRS